MPRAHIVARRVATACGFSTFRFSSRRCVVHAWWGEICGVSPFFFPVVFGGLVMAKKNCFHLLSRSSRHRRKKNSSLISKRFLQGLFLSLHRFPEVPFSRDFFHPTHTHTLKCSTFPLPWLTAPSVESLRRCLISSRLG